MKRKNKQVLSHNQKRVLDKLQQAKSEGINLFLTGADQRTAISLVRRGLIKKYIKYGVESNVRFELI